MSYVHDDTLNTESVLENITRTLLYEGYALYPYYRSAIKNQKPIPFGVVFPKQYNEHNKYAHSNMQTQCIVTANNDALINITVRFLHLKRIELFQKVNEENFIAVADLHINGKYYQAGWQTIERKIESGDLFISHLITEKKNIPFEFEKVSDNNYLSNEKDSAEAKQTSNVSAIKGTVIIDAAVIDTLSNTFKITVNITNTTPVENADIISRDEVLCQSFLSTHIILHVSDAEFISHQSPAEEFKDVIEHCEHINTYPILIDESNTTLLSSPIVLYDYPKINPQSMGDLFDSTEIEEALLLHVNMLSEEEKKRIGEADEKLKAMLTKVSDITPEELKKFHSVLKDSEHEFINKKI